MDIEVEVKVLLRKSTEVVKLKKQFKQLDKNSRQFAKSSQLNHYFLAGNCNKLIKKLKYYMSAAELLELDAMLKDPINLSIRTRKLNEVYIIVIKKTVDTTNSVHGTARSELEYRINVNSIDELDKLLLECDFKYQAKWSRDREEYKFQDYNVSIDRNAGYGYIVEFEKIVESISEVENTKGNIRQILNKLGLKELPQQRLDRMFEYYNNHWQEYYGTAKVFIID